MLVVVWFGVLGLLIGSFLNALVWRTHEGRSIANGRSICPHCHHQLRWYDLIPLVSWLALRGRCRDCQHPISAQYPVVELLTALAFAWSVAVLAPVSIEAWVHTLAWLWVAASLIALTVYDIRWYLLPDRILLPAIVPVALDLAVQALAQHSVTGLWHHAAAGLAGAGVFLAIASLSGGRWMGGGDVKLLFLMGLLLGPSRLVVALFVAFDSAAVVGLGLILAHRKSRRDYLPFGPFLALGTAVAVLYGGEIISRYLNLIGGGL